MFKVCESIRAIILISRPATCILFPILLMDIIVIGPSIMPLYKAVAVYRPTDSHVLQNSIVTDHAN